ncbi:MAG: hypothetical protein E6G49_05095 [Actinobacteria bacterium]|nr:MAG: hypothetical protein E6G49_05095 [Actinomycetota bacterium]
MQLLVSGAIAGREDLRGVTAVLCIVDGESGEVLHRCDYRTPAELRAPTQKMQFTGFSFHHGGLYVCSHTEVVYFEEWPPVEPSGRMSLPGFNDLHHCIPWDQGLAIANTGLETVDHVSLEGKLLGRWDLLADFAEAREIDRQFDYRRLPDTKPHLVHGNHLWTRKGELWVTQLRTARAVCLTTDRRPLSFKMGMPHDGRHSGGRLVFTTTNGHLAFVDPDSLRLIASYDLSAMVPGARILGWCRGVCGDPLHPTRFFVGFSFIRGSRWREYGFWLKHGQRPVPTRVDVFDVARGERLRSFEMTLPDAPGYVLFQLEQLPESLWV